MRLPFIAIVKALVTVLVSVLAPILNLMKELTTFLIHYMNV